MDDVQKLKSLKETIATLNNKKIRLEERYKSERERLEKLLEEITAKGYDPKQLTEIRKKKEEELRVKTEELEKKTAETATKLNAIEI